MGLVMDWVFGSLWVEGLGVFFSFVRCFFVVGGVFGLGVKV